MVFQQGQCIRGSAKSPRFVERLATFGNYAFQIGYPDIGFVQLRCKRLEGIATVCNQTAGPVGQHDIPHLRNAHCPCSGSGLPGHTGAAEGAQRAEEQKLDQFAAGYAANHDFASSAQPWRSSRPRWFA